MNCARLAAIAALLTLTSAAWAKEVVITDTRCVSADINHAHASITDYNNYSNVSGAKYQYNIPAYGAFPLLTMVKSQARYSSRESESTDGMVWVVLQPTNLTDPAFYPRLLIHCISNFDSPQHFSHSCVMDVSRQHYGLQNFISTLEATENSPICGLKGTLLVYRLVLDGNSADIDAIKAKAVEPWGPVLGKIIASFFNVESFFRSYYTNFYDSWAKSL